MYVRAKNVFIYKKNANQRNRFYDCKERFGWVKTFLLNEPNIFLI